MMMPSNEIISKIYGLILMASSDKAKNEYRSGFENLKRGFMLPGTQLSILDYSNLSTENIELEERNSLKTIKAMVIELREKDCPVTLICKQCHLEETRKQRTSAPHQPEYLGQCPDCFDVVYEGDCHECAE